MSLMIHIHSLATKNGPMKLTGSLDLTEFIAGRPDIQKSGPLIVQGQAQFNAGLVSAEGEAKADITYICSRCLTPFDSTLEFTFREGYTQDAAIAAADEDGEIHKVTGDKADLRPALEQSAMLALPFVPLCHDDCLGLCPKCGVNRNEQACSCKVETIDPRLAGLQDFFK